MWLFEREWNNGRYTAQLLLKKRCERTKSIHVAFLDLEKAFTYIQWIQLLYCGITSMVQCAVGTSPPFHINVGVHQSLALSPLLFVLCMDTVMLDLQSPHPWSLVYATTSSWLNKQREDPQEQTRQWNEWLG
ncbi:hypothetical protein L345_03550 [Ophiophagus hannah]|uniref:Reverse transcriptase domain-containing protein n=1 Tax=Ophiophagus hannah TaxID=8665 RepID=V8P9S6_OPHHA|nr:hypothetical protein L345_03550 [Ophiophagus hannah]